MTGRKPHGDSSARGRSQPISMGLNLLLVAGLVWLTGLQVFVETLPKENPDSSTHTDAIVVLTGGRGRLESGMELLAAGLAGRLFVSGVHQDVGQEALLSAHPDWRPYFKCCVELGYQANNTAGNAIETRLWAERSKVRSIRLVTSHYHMARSLLEFEWNAPSLHVIPHAVVTGPPIDPDSWWENETRARIMVGEYTKYLFVWVRSVLRPRDETPSFPGTIESLLPGDEPQKDGKPETETTEEAV